MKKLTRIPDLTVINGGLSCGIKQKGDGKQRKIYAFIVSPEEYGYEPTGETTCEGEFDMERVPFLNVTDFENAKQPLYVAAENEEEAEELAKEFIANFVGGDTERKPIPPIIILGVVTNIKKLPSTHIQDPKLAKWQTTFYEVTYVKTLTTDFHDLINDPVTGEILD